MARGVYGCNHKLFDKIISVKRNPMPQVTLNTPAPDFTLADFRGQPYRLADFRGKVHIVLVFNRGFV